MPDSVAADAELDVRAMSCPMPLLKTRQALRAVATGQILHVLASDPGALRDIPAWLRQSGHQLVQQQQVAGVIHFWIRRVD